MTTEQIIAAINAGTHVLVPAVDDWRITKLPNGYAQLEIELKAGDARAAAAALSDAEDLRSMLPTRHIKSG